MIDYKINEPISVKQFIGLLNKTTKSYPKSHINLHINLHNNACQKYIYIK